MLDYSGYANDPIIPENEETCGNLPLTCAVHTGTTLSKYGECDMCTLDEMQHRYPEWVERAKTKRLPVQIAEEVEIITEWQL